MLAVCSDSPVVQDKLFACEEGRHLQLRRLARRIEARLEEMGQKLERMRGLYESFFMGIERSPPDCAPPRGEPPDSSKCSRCPSTTPRCVSAIHALTQRWVLLITYWNRTLREIEAGTFSRDSGQGENAAWHRKALSTVTLAESAGPWASRPTEPSLRGPSAGRAGKERRRDPGQECSRHPTPAPPHRAPGPGRSRRSENPRRPPRR